MSKGKHDDRGGETDILMNKQIDDNAKQEERGVRAKLLSIIRIIPRTYNTRRNFNFNTVKFPSFSIMKFTQNHTPSIFFFGQQSHSLLKHAFIIPNQSATLRIDRQFGMEWGPTHILPYNVSRIFHYSHHYCANDYENILSNN